MKKVITSMPGFEVIKLEYSFKLKIKSNDWLPADKGPLSSQSLRFTLSSGVISSLAIILLRKRERIAFVTKCIARQEPGSLGFNII